MRDPEAEPAARKLEAKLSIEQRPSDGSDARAGHCLNRNVSQMILRVSYEGGQITYPSVDLYHTTKWGIEGFVEAVAKEVAPFNIDFTIVEPGSAKTSFAGGIVSPPPMPGYENTPSGEMRRVVAGGTFVALGDPVKKWFGPCSIPWTAVRHHSDF